MNQMNRLRGALIAASLLSGSAMAAPINCDVTPRNSVVADGETLQLAATCTGGSLASIELLMNGTSVSGIVNLSNHVPGEAVYFTSPVGLAASGAVFTVDGTPVSLSDSFGTSTGAKVVVKSAAGSAAVAASGFASTSTPVAAACGTANNQTVSSLPSNGALCTTGSKPALVVSAPTSYSWSCISLTGGEEANCYATRGVSYTVTATDNGSPYGSVSPTSQLVAGGSAAVVTATPADTYNTSWSSTCGGTPSGNTFTTNALSGNCTVSASFSTAPAAVNGSCGSSDGGTFSVAPTTNLCSATGTTPTVTTNTSTYTWSCTGTNGGTTDFCSATRTTTPPPPVGDDPGVGSGLWVPSGMTNRTVADISGPEGYVVSYVPGCLNGLGANSSGTGCAANSSFTGPLADTGASHTFSFGSGKQLVLRYRPKPDAGTTNKISLRVKSATGTTTLPTTVRVWLSTSPTATYDSVSASCKASSSSKAYVITGPAYCQISASAPVYYYGIEYDATSSNRFQIDQNGSDFY